MFTEGRLLLERVLAERRPDAAPRRTLLQGAIEAAGDAGRPPAARLAVLQDPGARRRRCAAHPLRELRHRRGPLPGVRRPRSARCSAAGTSSSRAPRAPPWTRRPARSPAAPSAPPPSGSTRWPRWASTSSTCRRSTRSARSTARAPTTPSTPGPDDTGLAVGDRLQGRRPRRHPPRPRHASRTSTPSSTRARDARPRGRARPRAAGRARPPVGDRATRSGSPPGPTGPSPTPRTRRRSTRTSTRSTSTTTRTASAARCCGSSSSGWRTASGSSGSTTRTPSRWRSGSGCSRRSARTDPDVLFLSEAFTRPAMMRGLGAVGFHQSYTYFTWRTAKWELEEYLREVSPRVRPPDAAELLRQHPRHPARLPAVRRPGGVQDPRGRSRRRARRAGACTPATSSSSTSRSSRAARSTSTRRSTRSGSATGTRAAAEGRTLAPYLTRLNEIRRAHPALQLLRNVAIHSSDDENVLVFSKHGTAPDGRRHRHRGRQPRPARRPARPSSTSTCPRSGLDWGDSFVVHDEITGAGLDLEPAQLRAARPRPRARARPDGAERPDR